ncbi:MAG: CRISPR-associated endonuclease Cas3'' [Candidatus Korarchaeota archaeon]
MSEHHDTESVNALWIHNCNDLLAARGQTMSAHIDAMLEAWDKIKNRYLASVQRLMRAYGIELDNEKTDKFMKSLVILHDIGKGVPKYQEHVNLGTPLGGYRHELISAVYARNILRKLFGEDSDKVAFLGALVIMLHHEPILMGFIERVHKEELSPEVIYSSLKEYNGVCEELEKFVKKYLGIDLSIIETDHALMEVLELSAKSRNFPKSNTLRLIVGGILLPLIICDYKGAERREGEEPTFANILREIEGLEG